MAEETLEPARRSRLNQPAAGDVRSRTRLGELMLLTKAEARSVVYFGARIQSNRSSGAFFGDTLTQFASSFTSPLPVYFA